MGYSTQFLSSAAVVFLFSLLILLLQNQSCSAQNHQGDVPEVPLNNAEREALIKIYTGLDHTSKNFSWNLSAPACSWKGVYCFSDNNFTTVLHLKFPGKSFLGQIPLDTIGKLTSLRVLSLRENGFSGNIPSDFSNLKSLTRLSLNNNKFNGSIPSYFSTFTKLNVLVLANNTFSGELPYIKAQLDKFDVSFNNLSSAIPPSLSKFQPSNFEPNTYICGKPTNTTCPLLYPPQDPGEEDKKNMTPLILGISLGSALLLLVLLWCVRKKVYHHQNKQPLLEAAARAEGENSFVLFDNDRICMLDMEDLLNASAVVLGEGSAGRSYKRVIDAENTTVVVKRLKDVVVTEKEFRKTMEDMGKMKNKNVVTLIAYYYSRYEKWIIYDYMPGGSLHARLHGSRASGRRQLDWDHQMRIALSSARGLEYLHAQNVIHGNIKSSNILIQQENNYEASVADYGLNTLFRGSSSPTDNTQNFSFDDDVYSFGVLLLEILTGKSTPKQDLSDKNVSISKWVNSIVCKEPPEIFDVELSKEHNIKEMMMQLFEIAKGCVSEQRTTMHVVVCKMENMWLRPSSDDHSSKGYDGTPSTETHDTPSTITP